MSVALSAISRRKMGTKWLKIGRVMPMPINIAPSSSVRPTGNRSDGGACIAVVFAMRGILPAMRRVWLLLWALWLALAPIGSAWAYACACTGQPALACCVRSTPCCKTPPAVRGEPSRCYSCPVAREALYAAGKVDDGLPPGVLRLFILRLTQLPIAFLLELEAVAHESPYSTA